MTDNLFIGILISIFAAISIAVYHQSDVPKQNVTHVISKKESLVSAPNVVVKKMNSRNPTMILPSGYHKIKSTYQRTTYIGTVDHPTINGGIITSTDDISINHSEPAALPSESPPMKSPYSNDQSPFQDDWATNAKVKRILVIAAENGKLDYVLKKANQMGLPASTAIIPMVESQYQTDAVSPKGAAGAWQLMPAVAKDYGISNQDRFQFSASTDTALKLIDSLHNQFSNWDLAYAAYNAGPKRIMDALHKNPRAKTINDLDVPLETKEYVSRVKNINYALGVMSFHGA